MASPGKSPLDLKNEGNAHFAKRRFAEALECYTEGIDLASSTPDGAGDDGDEAVLYSNRSSCRYEMGNYGEPNEWHTSACADVVVTIGRILSVHRCLPMTHDVYQ